MTCTLQATRHLPVAGRILPAKLLRRLYATTAWADSMTAHQPVMQEEALTGLQVRADGSYIDATYGRGGHSGALLAQLGAQGQLLAFDRDPEALAHAQATHAGRAGFRLVSACYSTLAAQCAADGLTGKIDGVLFDLGVSSPQLDNGARGFSFNQDGPLDMRMDPREGESAAEWLARADEKEIADVLWRYGDAHDSRRLARGIVAARQKAAIHTTAQLADVLRGLYRGPRRKIDPATLGFQAIRIHINQELDRLSTALAQALSVLAPGGRLVVISFHSLEDRIVKRYLRDQARGDTPLLLRPPRPQFAGDAEKSVNPRARSAVLRVAEKCA